MNRKDSEKWDAIETQLHVFSFYRIILICTAQSQTDWGGTHSNWSAKATVKYAILCPCRSLCSIPIEENSNAVQMSLQ